MTEDEAWTGSEDYSNESSNKHRKSNTIRKKQYRDEPPFDPESVSSDELFSALSQFGKYSTQCRHQIYKITYEYLTEKVDPSSLKVQNVVYLSQILQYAEENQRDWLSDLRDFHDDFFEDIKKDNFTSQKTQSALDKPISPTDAKELLQEQKNKLQRACDAAYGSAYSTQNKQLIRRVQRSYLWNIWDQIDNSEIEDDPRTITKTVHTGKRESCFRCSREQNLVGKYDIWLCRQCFREIGRGIGFKKYS